jgi:hypothetical protein
VSTFRRNKLSQHLWHRRRLEVLRKRWHVYIFSFHAVFYNSFILWSIERRKYWMMNGKGFGRKLIWPDRGNILEVSRRYRWKQHTSCQDSRCSEGEEKRAYIALYRESSNLSCNCLRCSIYASVFIKSSSKITNILRNWAWSTLIYEDLAPPSWEKIFSVRAQRRFYVGNICFHDYSPNYLVF